MGRGKYKKHALFGRDFFYYRCPACGALLALRDNLNIFCENKDKAVLVQPVHPDNIVEETIKSWDVRTENHRIIRHRTIQNEK